MPTLFEQKDFDALRTYGEKVYQPNTPFEQEGRNALTNISNQRIKLQNVLANKLGLQYIIDATRNQVNTQAQTFFDYQWFRIKRHSNDLVFFTFTINEYGIHITIDSKEDQIGYSKADIPSAIVLHHGVALHYSATDAISINIQQWCDIIADYIKKNELNLLIFKQILENRTVGRYLPLTYNSYNLILNGAPGTGKTYLAKEIAKVITGDTDENNHPHYEMVQFHPSYDYSDFVEGLRPVKDANGNIGFERMDGVFKAFCKKALAKTDERYVFIIDEINRGEMSKIFGELFFSIDPGCRGTKGRINTQYQNLIKDEDEFKNGFFVPENVYIIGTMNDIDRSVESMDFAMRRRFAFKEVTANDRVDMWNGNMDSAYINEAKKCMESMNKAIENIPGLSSAYHIGPSYFLKLKEYNYDFNRLWEYHIKGVVEEYLRGMSDAKENLNTIHEAYTK